MMPFINIDYEGLSRGGASRTDKLHVRCDLPSFLAFEDFEQYRDRLYRRYVSLVQLTNDVSEISDTRIVDL